MLQLIHLITPYYKRVYSMTTYYKTLGFNKIIARHKVN